MEKKGRKTTPIETIAIKNALEKNNLKIIGKIPYDKDFYRSQIDELAAVEYNEKLKVLIQEIWNKIKENL